MTDKGRLLALIPRLKGRRIVVVGDLFLDEYVVGRATRLSREAPIPVLELERRFYVPGGAANPAHNVVALGSQAEAVGVIGQDEAGKRLLASLAEAGIGARGVVTDPSRPTTTKTRIVAQGSLRFPQQLARIDHLDRSPVRGQVAEELLARLAELIPLADAVLLSDYKSGVIVPALVTRALAAARRQGKLITVDSQGELRKFRGFDLVKCNRAEAEAHLGLPLQSETDFEEATQRLLRETGARAVIITRGPEGMSVRGVEEGYFRLPAANLTEVFDVTGAGDTVIAMATLALVAGGGLREAALLANYAAGLVVRKLGNATPTPEELAWAIENWEVT